MSERTLSELIITLSEDFEKCFGNIINDVKSGERQDDGTLLADHGFNARQLVRAGFSYIEGAMFALKMSAVDYAIDNEVGLTPSEIDFALEVSHSLNDRGMIVEGNAHINLSRNIKFAFNLYSKAYQLDKQFDAGTNWWSELRKAIKIRDRVMHPRTPEDLDLFPDEVLTVVSSIRGFENLLAEYVNLK